MKKILLTLVLLVGVVFGLFAQKLTYQAVIRDNSQQLVVNTPVTATITINFATGSPYTETVTGTTNLHGLLSFEFGDGSLIGRDWEDATITATVKNSANPSTVYVNALTHPVSAVPYALSVNGTSIQQYLTEHNYVDLDKLKDTLNAYSTTAAMDARGYLTSDSAVITMMQGNIQDLQSLSHSHANMATLNRTERAYRTADSTKLAGIAAGAEVNVQSDWNQTTTTADDYIKNKPEIPTVPTNVSAFANDAGYLTKDSVTITSLASLLNSLSAQITAQNEQIAAQNDKMDSLSHLVDSLSQLPHGGGSTPTEVADGQPCPGAATVTDVDNNTYNTVKIGNQCWTKENLRTKTHTYGNVYTKSDVDSVVYGRYYDWEAVMQVSGANTASISVSDKHRGICPEGWHVPSDAEWTALENYVNSVPEYRCGGTDGNIANALSAATGWNNSSTSGCNAGNQSETRNRTNFSAVAAGYYNTSSFTSGGSEAIFWSATQGDANNAWYHRLSSSAAGVLHYNRYYKTYGYSVRCLRDAGIGGTPGSNETGGSTPSTMSCEDVMECMGDTLGKLNDKIVALNSTVSAQGTHH